MIVTIEPIKPLIGATVHVNKAQLGDHAVVDQIRAALEQYGVLVFPRINLSDEEQLALTDKFGARSKFELRIGEHDFAAEDVYKITLDRTLNAEPDYVLGTFFWHIDGIILDIPLPKAGIISARQLAASGGATEFANLYAAYDKLPDEEKRQIEGLMAIHSIEAAVRPAFGSTSKARAERYRAMSPAMEQPLVWTHPNGRKSLLVGTHADGLVGWPGPQGRSLLWRLKEWAVQPDFVYTHHWQVGDLVIWDNEALMHRVAPYTDVGRIMHRTQVAGEQKPGHAAAPEVWTHMLELG